MSTLPLVKVWLWISVLATVAGWLLSAVGQLNRLGYAMFFAVAGLMWCVAWRGWKARGQVGSLGARGIWQKKSWCRFQRPLPAFFVLLAALVLLGGILYAPSNHTGLSYRVPRVLNWLTEGHWYWIHTPNYRMNDRACGMEWLMAPLMLFLRSDRWLFLLNYVPYLMLPGLVFSLLRQLGVCGRVAWHWMWLLPTGYSFLLQAGGIGNDTFPAVYALASVDFGLRAWRTRRVSDLWYALVAAALLTGAKASNLPLLLPWVIVFAPRWRLLLERPVATSAVLLVAAAVSFLPTAILNTVYCGDWSGLRLERAGMHMKDPVVGIWGNALLLLLHNLVPTFCPFAGWWNASAMNVLPAGLVEPLRANFEAGFHTLWELPSEDWSGLGFGLSVLIVVSLFAGGLRPRSSGFGVGSLLSVQPRYLRLGVLWSAWVALLAYCVKSGMVMGARLISPYYGLLLPSLLLGTCQGWVVRRRWWQWAMWCGLALALAALMVAPARPLWPALTVLGRLREIRPESGLIQRAERVYGVYRERTDPLAALRGEVLAGVKVVGFMADGDDLDISLWRPFFGRKVEHVLLEDTRQSILQRGMRYVVVGGAHLAAKGVSLETWLSRVDAERVATMTATLKVAEGPQQWHVVRVNE